MLTETIMDTTKERSILSYKNFRNFLPFNGIIFLATYMRSEFIAGYGAAWFAGCTTVKADNHCHVDLDYGTYNFYLQLWNSMSGLFSFLCAGIVGYLSDKFGRKPFLYFQLFTTWAPYIPILFYNNMYMFLGLLTLMGLNGSTTTLCPAQNGFIADSLPNKLRLKGFGTVYTMGGTSLLLGTILSYVISKVFNDFANFYIINGLFLFLVFYLKIFVSEPHQVINENELTPRGHHTSMNKD